MAQIVILGSDAIKDVQKQNDKIAEHFRSVSLAESYLNGIIDWDGNSICGLCKTACYCPISEIGEWE